MTAAGAQERAALGGTAGVGLAPAVNGPLDLATTSGRYVGRFAPSPTGPLHAGSLVAALASWLDARAFNEGRGGQWLIRIEDVDTPRCSLAAAETILAQLAACGLRPDGQPVWQSARGGRYQAALDTLVAAGRAYPCGCSRKDIEDAHMAMGHARERHAALPYPGTCRHGLSGKVARSWRLAVPGHGAPAGLVGTATAAIDAAGSRAPGAPVTPGIAGHDVWWHDRRLGAQHQNVATAVGDFVLRRADGLWAYQLAVVVDDGDQGVTDVVRGEDLADNTARQILLQQALGLPTPRYLHTPLVCGDNGEKLSKQNGARALDLRAPVAALAEAAQVLGLPPMESGGDNSVPDALAHWVKAWRRTYNHAS
ncbi:tRNA glutamyl-Q(34) synthetase GluQRS [Acidovorax sp. RAC01]|uniref:tRNA glutamyl-Q(34) synthetase GluQRS n=1 Tax=Acidovorax sp. RAC01 TaxID=1842533 RepID=UPI00085906C7|nr:tRNA glutamyl-Q(34) synthetase GluQRS [Acidovorax sp. RAC01]AOG22640.1 glutamyl-queuosine tRNA(Asp) synthetase [Acidovorax sp. RAC01]